MEPGWRRIDLDGGGLQSANVLLARRLRRRPVAWALLPLFPLGLHRDYLGDARAAWAYRVATLAVAGLWAATGEWSAAAAGATILACGAAVDAWRMEERIAAANKALRMQVWLGHGASPPAGFRGRRSPD
jgi:hypothetical protein